MWERFVAAGKKDEEIVRAAFLKNKGGQVVVATPDEDIKGHVDFWWTPPNDTHKFGVDVKGLKKIERRDFEKSITISWLELVNVLGEPGWLYGKSSYIAFIAPEGVLLVPRIRLMCFAEGVVAGKTPVTENPQRCYIPYRRAGRKDLIVMVQLEDLIRLSTSTIPLQ